MFIELGFAQNLPTPHRKIINVYEVLHGLQTWINLSEVLKKLQRYLRSVTCEKWKSGSLKLFAGELENTGYFCW